MLQRVENLLSRWMIPPSAGVHWDMLDGLRGIAVLMVVACHGFYFNPQGSKLTVYAGHLIGTGSVGVQIFFVLSGFLISYPFFQIRSRSAGAWYPAGYATRRILKIFPPLYVAIVILAVFYHWHYRDPSYYVVGLQWAVGIAHLVDVPKYFNTSFWSVWVEVGFYLLLPVLFFAFRRAGDRTTRWAIVSILFFGSVITRLLVWSDGASPQYARFITARFPGSLDNFAWGVLFASFYVNKTQRGPGSRRLAAFGYAGIGLLVLSLCLLAFLDYHVHLVPDRLLFELNQLLPGVGTVLILFFLFNTDAWACRLLSGPVLRYVGLVSYEWFLFHQPAQFQFRHWFGSSGGHPLRYLVTVLVPTLLTFLLAALVYQKFSLPIMQWGRRRIQLATKKETVVPAGGMP